MLKANPKQRAAAEAEADEADGAVVALRSEEKDAQAQARHIDALLLQIKDNTLATNVSNRALSSSAAPADLRARRPPCEPSHPFASKPARLFPSAARRRLVRGGWHASPTACPRCIS